MMRACVLLALWLILALPGPAGAQSFPVTAGEHPGFTRVVVHAPPGIGWSLNGDGLTQQLALSPANTGFDLSRLFQRIPRTRLEAARTEGGTLTLTLACPCPVTAWEERPGLIVLDIADPAESDQSALVPPPPAPPPEAARAAGVALARERASLDATRDVAPPDAVPLPDRAALLADLGLPVAQALTQGLLEPAVDGALPMQGLLQAAPVPPVPALPPNIRVTSVTERPDPEAPPQDRPPEVQCQASGALTFLTNGDAPPFAVEFARLSANLFGEFDHPSAEARQRLIELYLVSGFGAEARALLTNSADPVLGRDLLFGLADVLEGRNSNSRMRLAGVAPCGGAAAMAALLAGAPPDVIAPLADDIALAFSQTPGAFRATVGPDLVSTLIGAGALDAARVAADAMRRSPWTDPEGQALIDARLDRMRGLDRHAAERLDHSALPRAEGTAMLERVDLALEGALPVPPGFLDDVEALATAERGTDTGRRLMAGLIRLHARDGAHSAAFATLDRLAQWLDDTGENRRELAELRNVAWLATATQAPDTAFMAMVLARGDWRGAALAAPEREAMAARFLALGLYAQAGDLLPDPQHHDTRHLAAQAALGLHDPERALTLLEGDESPEATELRARALADLGQSADAARRFAEIGATSEAARAAIRARDWSQLEHLVPEADAPTLAAPAIAIALNRAPGHLGDRATPVSADHSAPAGTPLHDDTTPRPAALTRTMQPAGAADAPHPDTIPAAETSPSAPSDDAVPFDRMGLVSRGRHLVAESARLRETLSPLIGAVPGG